MTDGEKVQALLLYSHRRRLVARLLGNDESKWDEKVDKLKKGRRARVQEELRAIIAGERD